ncbi:MAG: P1 family peptidase [Firmicutes bacterium]|jgi:L-aminopeptidase/D-esterase-like protein|nr:P1 family peptidase [Bacillota bacterium]
MTSINKDKEQETVRTRCYELPTITDVPGVLVGHAEDREGLTGCTAVLVTDGAVAGVDVRGSAPGTRETDLMKPCNLVEKVHAIVLAGGSAYGLDAACGAMRFLEEKGVGFDTGFGIVPIVGAAVIFDLDVGNPKLRPDSEMGYLACKNASSSVPREGNAGAGLGATVGKLYGQRFAMKGGLGSWSIKLGAGKDPEGNEVSVIVGAIVVVNALGNIIDPKSGEVIAGAYDRDRGEFISLTYGDFQGFSGNTTIGVVATNAVLSKEGANKVAQMAHNGLARVIRPVHTMYDGDTVFALSTGQVAFTGDKAKDISLIGEAAASAIEVAVVRAVKNADELASIPAASSIMDS